LLLASRPRRCHDADAATIAMPRLRRRMPPTPRCFMPAAAAMLIAAV